MKLGAALALSASALCAACSHPAPDATPDGAVREWLDHMEDSQDDPAASREAYALLGPQARANLEQRAARSSQLQGRRTEPYEILAEGRFGLKFRPKSMKPTAMGDEASVLVLGADPATEHATVKCVHEEGGWRVEPGLPEVSPLTMRPDGGV